MARYWFISSPIAKVTPLMCGKTFNTFIMKKAILLVALFLGGMSTQMMAQRQNDGSIRKGEKHRYHNLDAVQFAENGVLFTVFTDGTFDFKKDKYTSPYRNGRNYKTNYYGNRTKRGRRGNGVNHRLNVKTDYHGNIVGINNICISYKRNGKVKQIGSVSIFHQRGQMVQVGGMSIEYNRFGDIRNTYGHINRNNRKVWHDDWITYNDRNDWKNNVVWEGRRNRNK